MYSASLSVAILPFARRKLLYGAAALTAGSVAGVALWPAGEERAAYPFAGSALSGVDPLWSVPPELLLSATSEDAARVLELLPRLESATARLETLEPRLANGKAGELSGDDRQTLREAWWQLFEPILAVDELKSRYAGWYGLSYARHARLHARAFALSFTALCAQVDAGLRILAAVGGKPLLPALFDEAMPQLGLPARTFSGLRKQLGRARDLFLVPLGAHWYDRWIAPHLTLDASFTALSKALESERGRALSRVLKPTSDGVTNELSVVRDALFSRWFPVQKNLATWAGDTRVARKDRRLVSDAQVAELKALLAPGDVIVERRNWYLSNIGLPGFWPHAALYVGTQAQILAALGSEPDVRDAYGDLGAHFAARYPAAWQSLAERDHEGHELTIIEAVSEGVTSASVEHSCAADYVAALRPRLPPVVRARAIERALAYWGRPYDFNFDFATDDQVVCSELVVKAYETTSGLRGLEVPYVQLLGRRAVPPTELVRTFRKERESAEPQLDFVYFLEGREAEKRAVVASAEALATTCDRPKWDIAQP